MNRPGTRLTTSVAFVLLIFFILPIAFAQERAISTPPPFEELFVELNLNGHDLNQVVLILRDKTQLLLSQKTLEQLRVHIPKQATRYYQQQAYYAPSALPGMSLDLNPVTLTLSITAKASVFKTTQLNQAPLIPKLTPSATGVFLNYDVSSSHSKTQTAKATNHSAVFEFGAFAKQGVFTYRSISQYSDSAHQTTRLETQWRRDFPEKLRTLRIGDISTRVGTWGGPVLIGGVQWSRNFNTQPAFQPYPVPAFNGAATLPSTVQLFLDDALAFRRDVPPGPFEIDTLPSISGAGNVRLVTRDLLGREHVVTMPYYSSQALLRPKLHNFSFEMGLVREDFAQSSNHYGQWVASGTDRWGITPQLTAEWHGELSSDVKNFGAGLSYLWKNKAIITADAAASYAHHQTGQLFILGLDRQSHGLSFGVRTQWNSRRFQYLGLAQEQIPPKLQTQAFISFPQIKKTSISFSFTAQKNYTSPSVRLLNASVSRNFFKDWSVDLTSQFNLDDATNNALFLTITHSFSPRLSGFASVSHQNSTQTGSVTLSRSLPTDEGMGYQLQTTHSSVENNQQARLSYQNNAGVYNVHFDHKKDSNNYRVDIQGGLTYIDKHFLFSRHLNSSFALVEVPGFNNIEVYHNHHLMNHTTDNGYTLIPNLNAYEKNYIDINGKELPLNTAIGQLQKIVSPPYRSGVIIKFDVKPAKAATFTLVDQMGNPLPAGAIIHGPKANQTSPIGYLGYGYLSELDTDNNLEASWPDHRCFFTLNYPKTTDPLPDLGVIVCKPLTTVSA